MGNPSSEVNALLGRGSEFEGKLTFEGTVRIDGKFSGEVFSDDTLIVGEGARVKAEITVAHVIIYGDVVGNINASTSIELHAPARLKGNIIAPSLVVEQGVIFDGNCQMASNPEQRQRMERELAEEAAVEAGTKKQKQTPPPEAPMEPAVV